MEGIIRARSPLEVRFGRKRSRGTSAPPRLAGRYCTPTEKCTLKRYRFREEMPPVRLPNPPAPEPPPGSFLLCSVFGVQGAWQQALYQWAYAQAREVARLSLPERDLLAVWN
jgi:hypothetical protein